MSATARTPWFDKAWRDGLVPELGRGLVPSRVSDEGANERSVASKSERSERGRDRLAKRGVSDPRLKRIVISYGATDAHHPCPWKFRAVVIYI